MKLAFLNPQGNFDPSDRGWTQHADFGGQLVYVKELALAAAALGHDVDIITRQMKDDDWPEFAGAEDRYPGHARVRILRLPCGPEGFVRKEDLWPHLRQWTDAVAAHYQNHGGMPDAATGHYGDGGLAAAILQRDHGVPFTFTGHSLGAQKLDKLLEGGADFDTVVEQFHFDRRIAGERVAMANARRVVTSTDMERLEQYGHRLYAGAIDPQAPGTFAVIPPGVNVAIFGAHSRAACEQAVAERIEAMIARDIPAERRALPFVIASSRLDRKKNHRATVEAWAQTPGLRDTANLALMVRGSDDPLRRRAEDFDGEARDILDELVEVIEAHNLWPCVTSFPLDSQLELAAAYRHLAQQHRGIFALTTVYEPFGLAPLEAMAAGLPAVATENGGPSESMRDAQRDYGLLVDPHDPRSVGEAFMLLAADKGAWQQFQAAGMQRVESTYTWTRTAQRYVAEIEAMLAGGPRNTGEFAVPRIFDDPSALDIDGRWLARLLGRDA